MLAARGCEGRKGRGHRLHDAGSCRKLNATTYYKMMEWPGVVALSVQIGIPLCRGHNFSMMACERFQRAEFRMLYQPGPTECASHSRQENYCSQTALNILFIVVWRRPDNYLRQRFAQIRGRLQANIGGFWFSTYETSFHATCVKPRSLAHHKDTAQSQALAQLAQSPREKRTWLHITETLSTRSWETKLL